MGRNFVEALGKVMRSLETTRAGFWTGPGRCRRLGRPGTRCSADRLRTPTDGRLYDIELALRLGATRRAGRRGLRCRPVVRRPDRRSGRAARRDLIDAPVLDEELLRRAKHSGLSDRQIAALRPELAGEAGVRTLRQRLGIHPVFKTVDTCAAEFEASTPYHYSSYELDPAAEIGGRAADRAAQGADPGLRPEPDRAGHRVRLLLRARRDHAERGRVRDRDGQLQPRDGVHRLRHRGPAVLRAADLRGRPRGLPRRIAVRARRSRCGRGDRAARRADPAGAGAPARGRRRADRRHPPRGHRPRRGPRPVRAGAGRRRPAGARSSASRPASSRPARSPPRSATRCWCGRPTCSAAAAWRSSTTRRPCTATSPGPPSSHPSTRCWWTGSSTTPSRSTSTRCATAPRSTSAASWSTSRRPASTPATPRARCRRSRWAAATSRPCAAPPRPSRTASGCVGLLNVQYALKDDVLYVLEANPRASRTVPFVSKATAVPLAKACARIMLGATIAELRAEGVLPARGRRCGLPPERADRGQGGGAAVPPVPQGRRHGRRLAARARR